MASEVEGDNAGGERYQNINTNSLPKCSTSKE